MNSYKKLINNSFIFAIGNLGSKLITFILVPLYTFYLSTEQYGTVDLVMTTITMLLPIVSASIYDGVLRFIMDKDKPRDVIVTNSMFIGILGMIIAFLFYPVLSFLNIFKGNLIFMYLILIVQFLQLFIAQFSRAIGKIKIYAVNGLLLTSSIAIFNILFLVYFNFGIKGYFWSHILANIISIIFLVIFTKIYKSLNFSKISSKTLKELLNYSVPLIPNSLMWFLVNASSRYFILFFIGISSNGIFGVASKIPALISLINQIFSQAWQISAIEEYENENKANFYSNVFTYLSSVLFIGSSALIVALKLLFNLAFSSDYYIAWKVVPFLLIGTIFSSLSGFLGTNYIAAKETKGVFKTSVYGGIISIILNFIFIPTFGIIGAGISSMVSFFLIFMIRFYDTKKYINMTIDWFLFIKTLIIIFIQIAVLMVPISIMSEFIIEVILFLILLVINKELFKPLLRIGGISH